MFDIFSNNETRGANATLSGVILTNFPVFGYLVKYCLECFDIPSQSKLKLRRK